MRGTAAEHKLNTWRPAMANNSEFSFHVHKKAGNADRSALYTVGIWEGTVLHSICHVQPIDTALAAGPRGPSGPGHTPPLQNVARASHPRRSSTGTAAPLVNHSGC